MKLKPFFKEVFLTFATQFIVMLSLFLFYRLLAINFGPEGVGVFSLTRKVVGFFKPFLFLGLWIGIPRYIATAKDAEQKNSYIKAGGLIVLITTFVTFLLVNFFPGVFNDIFFGAENHDLVFPFSIFLVGLSLHALGYSYFRGKLFIKTFNALQIINLALIPILVIIFFKGVSVEYLIGLIGIFTFSIALIFILYFVKIFFSHVKKDTFVVSLRNLILYSVPRIPAEFALTGLFSLGPIFAVHFASIEEVGYLAVGQSLLGATGLILSPLGLVLLPKFSKMMVHEKKEEIQKKVNFLIAMAIQCSIFLSVLLLIFTDTVIMYWLGPGFYDAVSVIRVLFCSVFFYVFYVTMKNILDSVKIKPINTINLLISLAIFLSSGIFFLHFMKSLSPIISLALATSLGVICLGVLTYISIRRIYPEKIKNDLSYFSTAILISVLFGVLSISLKPFLIKEPYLIILFGLTICALYFFILWLLKMEWTRELVKFVRE